MSQVQITVNGQTQIIQLGSLSAAVNQQITQAVASSAANAAVAQAAADQINLFTSGITDLGSITTTVAQTFDMGSI